MCPYLLSALYVIDSTNWKEKMLEAEEHHEVERSSKGTRLKKSAFPMNRLVMLNWNL